MSVWTSFTSWLGFAPSDQRRGKIRPNGAGSKTARPVTFDTAMTVSAVFAACRLRAETVANLPLRMYEKQSDGSRKEIHDHDLIKLLKYRPNRRQTRIEFFEQLMLNLSSSGNAYCLRGYVGEGVRKRLVSLQVINSGSIVPELLENGDLIYQWTKSNGLIKTLTENDIWHVRLFGNGLVGLSPLAAAAKSVGIALASDDRTTDLITKNVPSGAVTVPTIWPKKEQRDAIRDQIKAMLFDDEIPILGGGSKFEAFSLTPEDLELLATRRFSLEDIARTFGVPSVLINDTSASTVWGSGIDSLIGGYYKFNLRPDLEKIELSMVVNLLPMSDWSRYEFEFDADAILRSSKKDRVEMGTKEVNGGLITLNEYRKDEGRPPVAGGDEIRVAVNLAFLDNIGSIVPKDSKGASP